MERLSEEIIEELKQFSTPAISDAMNRFRVHGGCLGIKSRVPGKKIVGPALTVRKLPAHQIRPNKGGGDYLEIAQKGDVIVIENQGRMDCTVFGDILAMACKQAELAGTVIGGCCRDIEKIRETGYPVFSKGIYVQTGKDFTQYDALNVPIAISNVLVEPGDIIFGDDSGVLVIPRDVVEKVLEAAKEVEEAEALIRNSVDKGLDREDAHISLAEARKKYGYFDLQKPKED